MSRDSRIKLAILSNSTLDLLPPMLNKSSDRIRMDLEFWLGGFNQYKQEILNDQSELYKYAPDVVLLLLFIDDLLPNIFSSPFNYSSNEIDVQLNYEFVELQSCIEHLHQKLPETLLILNTTYTTPFSTLSGLEYNTDLSHKLATINFNTFIRDLVKKSPFAIILDIESLVSWMGYKTWYDARLWYLSRSRLSAKALQVYADEVLRVINAYNGKQKKCIVLDLDNTLWGGVVGEIGPGGIQLGEDGIARAFVDFQRELNNLSRKGFLLAISSKNNYEDALGVINNHPYMQLRENDFVAMEINWDDKATNIRKIAEKLNIGMDSLVFLDDSPVERNLVRNMLPDVLVPDMPEDPAFLAETLISIERDYFFKIFYTTEDRERTALYKSETLRHELEISPIDLEDFYRSLQMVAEIGRVKPLNIPRVAQLTQKTNQFNLTTRRYTDVQIEAASRKSSCFIYYLELIDRFGSNGIVGVIICEKKEQQAEIDTFLLSCRVMGRTAEKAFLAYVSDDLRKKGVTQLIGEYIPTPKNKPVANLYENLGFFCTDIKGVRQFWELDLKTNRINCPEWIQVIEK